MKHISKEEFQNLVQTSTSIAEVLRKLQYSACSSAYKSFYAMCTKHNISYKHFALGLSNRRNVCRGSKLSATEYADKYLVVNSHKKPDKKKLIEFKFLQHKCYGTNCPITTDWLDRPITLQLDHINGDSSDNRLINLRLLCPNCHSQTSTFAGRNQPKVITNCIDCGVQITKRSVRCSKCSGKRVNIKRRKFEISKVKLEQLMKTHSLVEIGKMYGVSDNAIRKRGKLYGLVD